MLLKKAEEENLQCFFHNIFAVNIFPRFAGKVCYLFRRGIIFYKVIPTIYLDFYRHFTLKNHQFLPRLWGKKKNADHFFKSNKNSVKFFFTKPLHKGFFAAFCHCPDHYRNRRDTLLKKRKNPQSAVVNTCRIWYITNEEIVR